MPRRIGYGRHNRRPGQVRPSLAASLEAERRANRRWRKPTMTKRPRRRNPPVDRPGWPASYGVEWEPQGPSILRPGMENLTYGEALEKYNIRDSDFDWLFNLGMRLATAFMGAERRADLRERWRRKAQVRRSIDKKFGW